MGEDSDIPPSLGPNAQCGAESRANLLRKRRTMTLSGSEPSAPQRNKEAQKASSVLIWSAPQVALQSGGRWSFCGCTNTQNSCCNSKPV